MTVDKKRPPVPAPKPQGRRPDKNATPGAKPRGKGASAAPTRPPAKAAKSGKGRDEAKQIKVTNRVVEKAARDAGARHAKMLEAHAKRKSTGQGHAPIPTIEEFTFAFVQERLRKSQARKREGDAKR